MFGGQLGSDKINFAYGDADFVNYVSMYKELVKNGLASSEVREGSNAAVQIVNTTSKEIANLEDDYKVITTKVPVTTRDEIYSSMFAISTFSVDFDRSMKILYLLQTDSEIRTLIQYGIEKEDYNILTLEDDKKNEYEVISLRDTAYKNAFEVMYTGNSYYTYPSDNSKIDDWDYVKNTNLDVTVGQYFPIDAYIKYKAELSDEEKAVLSNYDNVLALIVKTNALIEQMTYEEFLSFQEVYKHDILSIINRINVEIPADIELKQAYLLENQKLFDEIQAKIDEKLPEYETLNKALEEKKAKRDELTEQRDLLESDSDNYEANMEEIERLNTEINALKQEIKELNNQINALGISALQNEQMTYQIRVTSTQKDIDNLVTELNETLPNLLIELKEASPAAYELKTSEEFAILSKLYNKSYNAIKPKD
jgi:predicted  nucleic acid-binding Zn-ribbon protein